MGGEVVEGTISAAAVGEWYYIIIIIMVCGEWREGSKSCISSVIIFFGSHALSYDDLMDNEGFNFLYPDCSHNILVIKILYIML